MSNFKRRLLFLAYIMMTSLTLQANTCYANETLSLSRYLKHLKEAHPQFQLEKLNINIQQENRNRTLGSQDWIFSISSNANQSSHNQDSQIFPERQRITQFKSELRRSFWDNGSSLAMKYAYTHQDTTPSTLNRFDEHQSLAQIEYRLPLLENQGGVLSRLNYELESLSLKRIKFASIESQEIFLEEQALRFIDWVFLTEHRKIARKRLQLSEEELARTIRKRRSKLVAKVDVLSAENAVYKAKLDLAAVERDWLSVQAELAQETPNLDMYNITPEFNLYDFEPIPNKNSVLQELKTKSRPLQIIQTQIDQNTHQLEGFNSELKPRLDLIIGTGLSNEDAQFSETNSLDNPHFNIGFDFSYPLGNQSVKANLSAVHLREQQLKLTLESTLRKIASNYLNLYTQLSQLQEIIGINRKQIRIAKDRTDAELLRHNQGKSELSFVIQSRDNEQAAQLSLVLNATRYQKYWISHQSLLDQLL